MPYEDDYKMWLEKALIRMNPDWVCDEMSDNEFTHNWCHQYCGEEDAYITPKCLHMYYHHIARADRKTENSLEKPNNCEECEHWNDTEDGCADRHGCNVEPQTDNAIGCSRCEGRYDCYDRDMPHAVHCNNYGKITDEPQTDCAWGKNE